MKLYIQVFSFVLFIGCLSCHVKDEKPNSLTNNETTSNSLKTYLALGDSYTIGQSVTDSLRWPNQLVKILNREEITFEFAEIIARTGWTTDELLTAINAANISVKYDYVSLLIGVNNQYRGRSVESFEPDFIKLLNRAVAFSNSGARGVFVLSIPDWGAMPFAKDQDRDRIAAEINTYNSAIKRICVNRNIAFFDITSISREALTNPAYVAVDDLHPSGEMYAEWVKMVIPFFNQ
jgi:lysophospholipase L1-like esterase